MSVQHKDIPEAQLHESKGVSTALVNTVFKANGAGSGAFQKVDSPMLKGLSGDGGNVSSILVSDGANGFALKRHAIYGSSTITTNNTPFAVTAVADTSFNTASQFVLFTGAGAPWQGETLNGVTFSVDRLTVPVTGIYLANFWVNIKGFASNTAALSFRYRINGTTFVARNPIVKSAVAGDVTTISAHGHVLLNAGDYMQIYVASDTTGNITVRDVNNSLLLINQTA